MTYLYIIKEYLIWYKCRNVCTFFFLFFFFFGVITPPSNLDMLTSMARQSGIYSTLHGICVNIKNISQHNITAEHLTELVATNWNCVNVMETWFNITKYPSTHVKYISTLLQNILQPVQKYIPTLLQNIL